MDFPRVEVVDQGHAALLLRVETSPYVVRHFLVGQDSANMAPPFVTQVSKRHQTVSEAFNFLMPKAVKQAVAQGLAVQRQGDWFFVPSPPPVGPSYHHWMERSIQEGNEFRRAHPEFRDGRPRPERVFEYGILYYAMQATRHEVLPLVPGDTGQIVYRANWRHYVRGVVIAPDHEPIRLEDWHVAIRANAGPWGRNRGQPGAD